MQVRRHAAALMAPGILAASVVGVDSSIVASGAGPAAAVPRVGRVAQPPPGPPATKRTTPAKLAAPVIQRLVDSPVVGAVATPDGYTLIGSRGGVYSFGGAAHGSLLGHPLSAPIVASIPTPGGYRLVGSDGGVYTFGHARFYGSAAKVSMSSPIVAAVADPATGGYWLAGADGGVFAFHAGYYGSTGRVHLAAPIVAMAATSTGRGYWLIARDGGVFTFGDAHYLGRHKGAPAVAAASTTTGQGYWIAGSDGSVAAFGRARAYRPAGRMHPSSQIVAMAASPTGKGYWLASRSGVVFPYGSTHYLGAVRAPAPPRRPAPRPVAKRPATPVPPRASARSKKAGARRLAAADAPFTKGQRGPTSYRPGAVGIDISHYQCTNLPTSPQEIGIVQVTAGSLNSGPNPCLQAEARWAGRGLSAYLFMDGLPLPAPPESMHGRAGNCIPDEIGCQAYNYGFNWSRYWVGYARGHGVDPSLWWLDVETSGSWNYQAANAWAIRGAVDGLHSEHVQVGLYSTPYQWSLIAGNLTFPGMPVWTPGAGDLKGPGATATTFCQSGTQSFAGGQLALVQWGYTGNFAGAYSGPPFPYDLDYACK